MTQTIKCLYTCSACGLKDRPVQVPARTDEDVVEWMKQVFTPAIAKDHRNMSPFCQATSMTNAKIPLGSEENVKVGGV